MPDPITLPPGYEIVPDATPPAANGLDLPPGYEVVKGASAPEKTRGVDLDLLSEAGTNFLPSLTKNVGQMVEGIGNAVTSPVQTAKTLGKLALTMTPLTDLPIRLGAKGLSMFANDKQKKTINEGLADLYASKKALTEDYGEAYGGKQNILKTMGTDPVRVMSDLATIATLGEGALSKLPGTAGKVAAKTARVVQNLDPLTATGNVIAGAAKKIPQFFDITTGVGEGPMNEALRAGFLGGKPGADFKAAIKGAVPAEDVINTAKQGVQTLRDDMFNAYKTEKPNWSANQSNLGFDKINDAELKVANLISSKPGSTLRLKVSDADATKINKLTEVVSEWRRDPTSWTIEGLDDLKQRLRNEINWKEDKPVFHRAATTLVDGVREQIMQNAPPSYRKAMKAYTELSREIDNIEKAFSLGKNAQMQTAMSKLQSIMRNNANTQYGLRDQLFDKLEKKGNIDLRATLAGHALSSAAPRGLGRGVMSGGLPYAGSLMLGLSALDPISMGLGLTGYAAGRAATSPRTMGNTMYRAGTLARPAGKVWDKMSPETRRILEAGVSQPARNAYGALDRAQEDPFQGYADGGMVSPFGSLPTNLPQIAPLPTPAPIQARQKQMPMPDMAPAAPQQQMAPQRSELESIISGITGLVKQRRDEAEKKKETTTAKALMEQLAALQAQRSAGPMNSDGSPQNSYGQKERVGMAGEPADMDDYMARNAKFESGANEDAVNPGSGATGLFQFLPSTWRWIAKEAPELGLTDEGMKTRAQQMKAMRYYTDKSVKTLEPILGRKPTGGELYLLHLLGHSGGPAVLADLDAPITKTIGEGAYRGNPFLKQYTTGRDLIAGLNSRFGGGGQQ